MLLAVGQVLGVTEETREHNGQSWIERKLHLLDQVRTLEITLAKDFDRTAIPERDQIIAVEVSVRAWSGKNGVGYAYTGYRVRDLASFGAVAAK